jgi:EmrB/QacA subfamily drug resistance transporter
MTDLKTLERPAVRARSTAGWTLGLTCVAVFMLLLDVTVVAVALPAISLDLHASLSSLQWVIDAYTLPLAGLLLTAATMGDRLGRRRIFIAGMALFTLGSLGCALAPTSLALNLTRALQGSGAALLFGTALPLIGAAYPESRRRAGAIGIFGATLAAATAIGPLVGGALVDGPGWRWIFLVNVPIGVASLIAARGRLAESRADQPRPADWPGTVLLVVALLALLLGLIRGNTDGWASGRVIGLLVAGGLLLVGFVVRQLTARTPMVDLRLFAGRSFLGVGIAAFAGSATLVASTTYLALYVQNALGYSPLAAGLRFLPLTVVSFVAAPIAARQAGRIPDRMLLGGALALIAVGMWLASGLSGSTSWTHLLPGFVLAGAGMGISSAALSSAALSAVEPGRAGMATGTVNTLRQLGVAVGVAVLGAIFQRRTTAVAADKLTSRDLLDRIGSGAGQLAARGVPAPMRTHVAAVGREASALGLDRVLVIGSVGAAVAAIAAVVLIRK